MWYTRVLYIIIIMSAHVIIINNLWPAPHYETIVFPQYIYNTYECTHNNITCGTHNNNILYYTNRYKNSVGLIKRERHFLELFDHRVTVLYII